MRLKKKQKQTKKNSHNVYLDFGLSSRFVAHLWSLCVHVYICFVLYLATENLGPGFEASLQPHPQDTFNL